MASVPKCPLKASRKKIRKAHELSKPKGLKCKKGTDASPCTGQEQSNSEVLEAVSCGVKDTPGFQRPALQIISFLTLGILPHGPGPQFLHLQSQDNHPPHTSKTAAGKNEITNTKFLTQRLARICSIWGPIICKMCVVPDGGC